MKRLFDLSERKYIHEKGGSVCVLHRLDGIPWRGKDLLILEHPNAKNGSPAYHVLGSITSFNTVNGDRVYSYIPIQQKHKKNCRAFLRGFYSRDVLDDFSFDQPRIKPKSICDIDIQ